MGRRAVRFQQVLDRFTRQWWVYVLLLPFFFIPAYTAKGYDPRQTTVVVEAVLRHPFIYSLSAVFFLFKCMPVLLLVLLLAIAAFQNSAAPATTSMVSPCRRSASLSSYPEQPQDGAGLGENRAGLAGENDRQAEDQREEARHGTFWCFALSAVTCFGTRSSVTAWITIWKWRAASPFVPVPRIDVRASFLTAAACAFVVATILSHGRVSPSAEISD